MNVFSILSLISTLVVAFIGSYVYLKSSRNQLAVIFALFSFSIVFLNFSQFQLRIAANPQQALLWSKAMAIWPISLVLSLDFISELYRKKRRIVLFYLAIYLPGFLLSYLHFSTDLFVLNPIQKPWGWALNYNYGILYKFVVLIGVAYWMSALIILFNYYSKTVGKSKRQFLFILLGFLVSFIITMITDVFLPFLQIEIPEMGSVSGILSFSLFGYGILKYHLFSLEEDSLSAKLFGSLSDYLLLTDRKRHVIEINPKLLQRLKYSSEEVLGQEIDLILEPGNPSVNPISNHRIQNGEFQNMEMLAKPKSGKAFSINFSSSFVNLENTSKSGIIYFGTDMKESEAQSLSKHNQNIINFLAESALDLVNLKRKEEVYDYISDKIFNLLDRKAIVICSESYGDVYGLSWQVKSIKGISNNLQELNRKLGFDVNKMSSSISQDYGNILTEGKLVDLKMEIGKLTNGMIPDKIGNLILKLLGVKKMNTMFIQHGKEMFGTTAILSQKDTPDLDTELLESFITISSMVLSRIFAENEMEDLNRMQTKLFSIIGHDLKGPIGNVLGFSQLLLRSEESYSNEKVLEIVDLIRQSASSTNSILDTLLLWSKSIQDDTSIRKEVVDLKFLSEEAIEEVSILANKKQISVTNKIEDNHAIVADRNMIQVILRNILSNAIKFTPHNGKVFFEGHCKNGLVEVSITDTGIGMTEEQVETLFQFDKKNTRHGTDNERGTGLGLQICKSFIKKNEGTISVKSQEKKGSSFILSFPTYKNDRN